MTKYYWHFRILYASLKEPLPNFENRIYQGMENLVPPRQVCSVNRRAGRKAGSGAAVDCHFDAKKHLNKKYWKTKKLCWKNFLKFLKFSIFWKFPKKIFFEKNSRRKNIFPSRNFSEKYFFQKIFIWKVFST